MEEQEIKLQAFEESISKFQRMTLNEFKEAYKEYEEENDKIKKDNLRKKMIEQTLYIVCEFIKKSGFMYLTSSKYDMDDVISASCELWIKSINDGTLAQKSNFKKFFSKTFYERLVLELNGKYPLNMKIGFGKEDINNSLEYFLNRSFAMSYDELSEYIINSSFSKGRQKGDITEEEMKRIYDILNCIYMENIDYENKCVLDITKTFRETLVPIIVDNSYLLSLNEVQEMKKPTNEEGIEPKNKTGKIDNSLVEEEQLEQILLKIDLENQVFNSRLLSDKEKHIIYAYYMENFSEQEIGKIYGVSKQQINSDKKKALRKIKESYNIL